MKIAVASNDGVSMSQHIGQSTGFIIFEVEGKEIKGSDWRVAKKSPHAAGICQHGGGQSHGNILEIINDCKLVLCGGMGAGAAQGVIQQGLQPVIIPGTGVAQEVLSRYLNGEVTPASSATCNCSHHHH